MWINAQVFLLRNGGIGLRLTYEIFIFRHNLDLNFFWHAIIVCLENYFALLTLFLRNVKYVCSISRLLHMTILCSSSPSPFPFFPLQIHVIKYKTMLQFLLGIKNLPLTHSYGSIKALTKSISKSERGHELVIAVSCILLGLFLKHLPELIVFFLGMNVGSSMFLYDILFFKVLHLRNLSSNIFFYHIYFVL